MSTDLKRRNVPFSPPDMTEAEANEVRDTILSGWITTGPRTKKLEKLISEYVGTEKTVCLNSATAAMEMVLHVLGVGSGDEVIMPAYTYTASASVVDHVGANVDKIMEVITRPEILAKFTPANDIQKLIGRIVISNDCAHSFGAQRHGKMAGAIADFSSFSFHAVKNFTTAEGGAMTWSLPFGGEKVKRQQVYCGSPVPFIEGETWNEFIYRLSQLFSLHGQNKDALAKTKLGAWEYDIIGPWYKCNMTDIMAALGLIQFERYPKMLAKRRKYIERYDKALAPYGVVGLRHYGADWAGSGHLYIVRFPGKTREECNHIIEQMAERGIATNVHYKPLPMMTAYKAKGLDIKDYPNAFEFFSHEVTLPLNTKMTDEDLVYVIENLIDILKSN